jgi:hypothetical protein
MSQEINNKRSNIDDNRERSEETKNLKISVISGSSNAENHHDDSVVLRKDNSKVIIKVKESPVKESFFKKIYFQSTEEHMVDDSSTNSDSNEKANVSQKIFDSILVTKKIFKNTIYYKYYILGRFI